jgi:hypothetical protein
LGLNSQRGLIRPVTTISGTAIETGQTITPQSVGHAGFSEGTLTQHLPFQSGAGATLIGTRLAVEAGAPFAAQTGGTHTLAPSTILMGGEGDKEGALLAGRPLREPLRLRLGTNLGGRYEVGGRVGEFHGDAFKGMGTSGGMNGFPASANSRGNGQPRLSVLPHGQSAEAPRIDAGEMTHAGSEGGLPSTASPGTSAPSASHSTSSSSSASSGGHH